MASTIDLIRGLGDIFFIYDPGADIVWTNLSAKLHDFPNKFK